jgi:hypothetical protein
MQNCRQDFFHLREKHPIFNYLDFSWNIDGGALKARYHFFDGQHEFFPEYTFPVLPNFTEIEQEVMDNFLFHIGLCETISYWKTSCAPILDIHPFYLDSASEKWWRKLFYNGLGEFRYLNGIECEEKDFIQFRYSSERVFCRSEIIGNKGVLIPVGGGKDSVVTLEILSKDIGSEHVTPFMLNGIPASQRTIVQAGFSLV